MNAVNNRPVLLQLECPNCGAPFQQNDPGAQTIICNSCGAYIEVGTGAPAVLGTDNHLQRLNVPIKVGDMATIEGTEYFVLGRVDYLGWEPGDKSETWRWTEWLLGEKKGRLLWLAYDEHGFTLYKKIRHVPHFDVHTAPRIPIDGASFVRVHERYPARITGARGELTWRPKIGSELFMIDAAGLGKRYSVQQTGEEIEVYEGDPLDELALAQTFNDKSWVRRVKRRTENSKLWGSVGALCFLFAILGVVAAFVTSGIGEVVQQDTVSLSTANPQATIPIELNTTERPVLIGSRMSGSLRANSSFDVEFSIRAPNETETYLFPHYFWHETGSDEDGPWTDTQYSTEAMFVPMERGAHTLVVSLADPVGVDSVSLDVRVERGRFLVAWFFIYAVLAGLAGVGAFVMAAGVKKVASTLAEMSSD